MKKLFTLVLLATLSVGCDAPMRGRMPMKTANLNSLENGNNMSSNNLGGFSNSGSMGGTTSGATAGSGNGTTQTDSRFTNCDESMKYHTIDIGYFGLCQSQSDDTLFKIKFQQPSGQTKNCLIPTYRYSDGSSTYFGRPQCVVTTQENQVVIGNLYKDLPSSPYLSTSAPINGVVVMKEHLYPGYYRCMDSFAAFKKMNCPQEDPYRSFNTQCSIAATNYRAQVCNAFISQYKNYYVDLQVR